MKFLGRGSAGRFNRVLGVGSPSGQGDNQERENGPPADAIHGEVSEKVERGFGGSKLGRNPRWSAKSALVRVLCFSAFQTIRRRRLAVRNPSRFHQRAFR